MLGRKSRPSGAAKRQAKAVKVEIERRGEDFGKRAEAMVEALSAAVDRIQDLSATAGRRAGRRGRVATRRSAETAKDALAQARQAIRQVPDWDQMAVLARKASDQILRERALRRRKEERRRRMRMVAGGLGVAGLGAAVLARRGASRRSAMREVSDEGLDGQVGAVKESASPSTGESQAAGSTASVPTNRGATTAGPLPEQPGPAAGAQAGGSDQPTGDLDVTGRQPGSGNGSGRQERR